MKNKETIGGNDWTEIVIGFKMTRNNKDSKRVKDR